MEEIEELEEAINPEIFIDENEELDLESRKLGPDTEPNIDAFYFVSKEPEPINLKEITNISKSHPRDSPLIGLIVARVLVDHKGNYVKHRLIKRSTPHLNAHVENEISNLKFHPAVDQNGQNVMFWVNIPFNFHVL